MLARMAVDGSQWQSMAVVDSLWQNSIYDIVKVEISE
jgi:hypothetical protein